MDRLERDDEFQNRFSLATSGETRIQCLNKRANQLTGHGYLHNHSRMWFASLWTFWLGLQWQLGADFFLRNLLDGDPATNTLSWPSAVGLQTSG